MKKVGIALILMVVTAGAAIGQEARPTLDKIKATGAIALGYRETSIPFSFVDKDKKPTGYSVDLCLRIATAVQRRLGLKDLAVSWVPVTPSSRISDLVRGVIDLECGSTTITFSRMEQVDFSFLTFVDGGSVLATAASKVTGVGDLGGKRVAVSPGTTTVFGLYIDEVGVNHGVVTRVISPEIREIRNDTIVHVRPGPTPEADLQIMRATGRTLAESYLEHPPLATVRVEQGQASGG